MGMDFIDVKDFLEDKGLSEENIEIVIDHLKNANYRNPLRVRIPN